MKSVNLKQDMLTYIHNERIKIKGGNCIIEFRYVSF